MIKKQLYLNFWRTLKKHDNYLITTHINPDGDGICSVLIFTIILKSLNKKYFILMEDSFPEKYKFLINDYANFIIPELINVPKNTDFKSMLPAIFKPESVIILDVCGNNRLGSFSKYFSNLKTIVNIDHHSGKRKFPGIVDLIDPTASATGEIIFNLLKTNKFKIQPNIAKLIYISIISDTNNFTQSNTTSETHFIISEILKTDIKPEELHFCFEEQPAKVLQVFGKAISRLKVEYNNKLVWSYLSNKELKECPDSDVDGLIETIRNVKNTQIAILFKEISKDKTKVCLRGKRGFNVYKIARQFNGGGHKQASGFIYEAKLNKAIKLLLSKFKKYL